MSSLTTITTMLCLLVLLYASPLTIGAILPSHCPQSHYVYTPSDPYIPSYPPHFLNPLSSPHPILDMSIYGAEQRVYFAACTSPCRVLDPAQAGLFIIPVYTALLMHKDLYNNEADAAGATADLGAAYDLLSDVHYTLARISPYYARNNGSDHVLTIAHDIGGCLGPNFFTDHVHVLQHFSSSSNSAAIAYLENTTDSRLLDRASLSACYNKAKDVVIPPFIGERDSFAVDEVVADRHVDFDKERSVFFHFRGSVHENTEYSGGVRQSLRSQHVNSLASSSFHFELLSDTQAYWRELNSAVFCLSPGGWVSWSPRTFQILAAGCIPVLFTEEGNSLPFEGTVEWRDIAIFVDGTGFTDGKGDVAALLAGMRERTSDASIRRMRAAIARTWRVFTYGRDPRKTEGEQRSVVVAVVEKGGGGTAVVESGGEGGAFDYILKELSDKHN